MLLAVGFSNILFLVLSVFSSIPCLVNEYTHTHTHTHTYKH
jgi:hypothetical protein